jgi:hypothetical protein
MKEAEGRNNERNERITEKTRRKTAGGKVKVRQSYSCNKPWRPIGL